MSKEIKFFLPNKKIRKQAILFRDHLETPFVLKKSKNRYYLNTEAMGYYMTAKGRMNMAEVSNVDKVKKYIIENELYKTIPKINGANVEYFHYNPNLKIGDSFNDCYEIDLEKAYWETANNLKLLRPDIYPLAYKKDPSTKEPIIGRDVRLACIGSLARQRRIYTFDGNKVTMTRERSPITAHIWDYIADLVSKVMFKGAKAAKNDFVFFWVDAVFVKSSEAKDAVTKAFDKAGYKYKVMKIKKINAFQNGNARMIKITDNVEDRDFPYAIDGKKMKYNLTKMKLEEVKTKK